MRSPDHRVACLARTSRPCHYPTNTAPTDTTTAIRMIYDNDGRFLHPEPATDTDRHLHIRSIAARHAMPLTDYLTHHEPHLLA